MSCNTNHRHHSVIFLVIMGTITRCAGENVLEKLSKLERFSQFLEVVRRAGPHSHLLTTHLTVLAPSNEAIQAYQGTTATTDFILNHLVSTSVSPEEIGSRLSSLMKGNPPLFVKKIGKKLFVNQAKVLASFPLKTTEGKEQHLYLIDSVLTSLVPNVTNNEGTPRLLIDHLQRCRIGNFSVKTFSERVKSLGMENFPQFSETGKFTIFLPVDSSFQEVQEQLVDEEVVRGHLVPHHTLFSRPRRGRAGDQATAQYSSSIQDRTELSVVAKIISSDSGARVESLTLVGNTRHHRGLVTANILLGDISVNNGVVHLIDKPLVIMTRTMLELLSDFPSSRYQTFHSHLKLLSATERLNETKTLLVPTNKAFDELEDQTMDEEMIDLHFLTDLILESDIRRYNFSKPLRAAGPKRGGRAGVAAWFWCEEDDLYVSRAGLTARIEGVEVTRRGVIYSIDTVLMTASLSLYDHLSSGVLTKRTFQLGEQSGFNEHFRNGSNNFTYFVPTNQAWERVSAADRVESLSAPQLRNVLESHLVSGARLGLHQLRARERLTVQGGPSLVVRTQEDRLYLLTTDGRKAKIIQADIECRDGVIHLIDTVIMQSEEVRLGSGVRVSSTSFYLVLFLILALYGLKTIPIIRYII